MVISRLFTFIVKDRSQRFLDDYQLANTTLVIDGWNLACDLYSSIAAAENHFNVPYNHYAKIIRKFFNDLRQCQVTPIIIFAGGWETGAKEMIINKTKQFLLVARNFESCHDPHNHTTFFPLQQGDVFLDVVKEMKIKFVMCTNEANKVTVTVARLLDCPVLTRNSDFFIYGVKVIPTTTLNVKNGLAVECNDGVYRINCQIYTLTKIQALFPGLEVSFLPLMWVFFGDNHDPQPIFRDFFHLQRPPQSEAGEILCKIELAFKWLSKQLSRDSAVRAILQKVPEEMRTEINDCIQQTLERHSVVVSRDIIRHLALDGEILRLEYEDNSLTTKLLPGWFMKEFFVGKFHAFLINMFIHQTYILPIHIEDFHYNSPHEISLNIIQAIYRLLMSVRSDDNENTLEIIIRAGDDLQTKKLIVEKSLVCLENLRKFDLKQRMRIINNILGISDENILEELPENWRLYIVTAVYWMKQNVEPVRNAIHLDALLFALLFGIIDKKLGLSLEFKHKFWDKYGEDIMRNLRSQNVRHLEDISVIEAVEAINKDDCIMAAWFFLSKVTKEQDKTVELPQESRITISHVFTQFQSCLRHTINLNALLNHPYQSPKIAELLHVTLLHNLYMEFSRQSDIDVYISTELKFAPGVIRVYCMLKKCVQKLLSTNTKTFANINVQVEKKEENSARYTTETQVRTILCEEIGELKKWCMENFSQSTMRNDEKSKITTENSSRPRPVSCIDVFDDLEEAVEDLQKNDTDDEFTDITAPKPLSDRELTVELRERRRRICNICVSSSEGLDFTTAARAIELIKAKVKIDPKVVDIKQTAENQLTITLGSYEIREEVISAKNDFYQSDIWIDCDYTARELQIQNWLKAQAVAKRQMGKVTRVGYFRLMIDDVWWKFNEKKGELEKMTH